MNKTIIAFAAVTGMILSACGNGEPDDSRAHVMQYVSVTVADAGCSSRAGRGLDSAAPGQDIENVKIILADGTGLVRWTTVITDWNGAGSEITGTGRATVVGIPKEEFELSKGVTYTIYGIGYSTESDYNLSGLTSIQADGAARYASDRQLNLLHGAGEEIFAGFTTVTPGDNGTQVRLTLNRQVAGTYGYLINIPYVESKGVKGTRLRLVASSLNSTLVLGCFSNADHAAGSEVLSVVNGTAVHSAGTVYDIDLYDWFESIEPEYDGQGARTGLIKVADNWKGDSRRYRRGSVYGSSFLIPFAAMSGQNTFRLQLTDATGETMLREWNVKLPQTSSQLKEYELWTWNGSGWSRNVGMRDTESSYNVLRNHLYAIGTKLKSQIGGDSENPGNPDAGDVPQPLNNKEELTVTVDHNWNIIYNLGID